jgi:hypothetical protein
MVDLFGDLLTGIFSQVENNNKGRHCWRPLLLLLREARLLHAMP